MQKIIRTQFNKILQNNQLNKKRKNQLHNLYL